MSLHSHPRRPEPETYQRIDPLVGRCPYTKPDLNHLKWEAMQRRLPVPPSHIPEQRQKEQLINALVVDDTFNHPYLQWHNYDLHDFVKARGLTCRERTKSAMIKVLEKADAEATFPVMDLPPEIRCKIYEYVMGDYSEYQTVKLPKRYTRNPPAGYSTSRDAHLLPRNRNKPIPALAKVSTLVRKESLHLFQQMNKDIE